MCLCNYLCAKFFGNAEGFLVINGVHNDKCVNRPGPVCVEPAVGNILLVLHADRVVDVERVCVLA